MINPIKHMAKYVGSELVTRVAGASVEGRLLGLPLVTKTFGNPGIKPGAVESLGAEAILKLNNGMLMKVSFGQFDEAAAAAGAVQPGIADEIAAALAGAA